MKSGGGENIQVEFDILVPGNVSLNLYNIQGQKVVTVINEEFFTGRHSHNFNIKELHPGLYLTKLIVGDIREYKTLAKTQFYQEDS